MKRRICRISFRKRVYALTNGYASINAGFESILRNPRKLLRLDIGYHIFVIAVLTILMLLASCNLETPPEPVHNNPWDPDNPNPPRCPAELTGEAQSETDILIRWQDMSGNEIGFFVYESIESDTSFDLLQTVAAKTDSLVLLGKTPATDFFYQVSAFNGSGSSPLTEVLFVSTSNTRPTPPVNLEASVLSVSEIELTWADRSFNESGFRILESRDDTLEFAIAASVATNENKITLAERELFVTYYYKIVAFNDFGESAQTDVVMATPGSYPPAAPVNLVADPVSEIWISLSWMDESENEEEFELFVSEDDSLNFRLLAAAESQQTGYLAPDCVPGRMYYFKMRSKNRYGVSDFTPVAWASTDNAPPASPESFEAHILNETDFDLTWIDRSAIEAAYEIEESVDNSDNFSLLVTTAPDVTSFPVENRVTLGTYYYRIRTVGASENSAWSEALMVIVGSLPPDMPTDLDAMAVSMSEIDLTWVDNSTNEDHFEIEERLGIEGSWQQVATSRANTDSTRLYGKTSATTYYYRIRAVNDYGESDFSVFTQTTTPSLPIEPSQVNAEGISPDEIRITWRDASHNETGFQIEKSASNQENFTLAGEVEADITEFSVSEDLQQFTTYYFRVRAVNEFGVSRFSNVDSAVPLSIVAVVGAGDAGVVMVNISDPASPQQIGQLDTPGYTRGIKVAGNTIFAADAYSGIRIIDAFDPVSLRELSSFDTDGRARNIQVSGNYAYVADETNGLVVLDVSDHTRPLRAGVLAPQDGWEAYDVCLSGNYAFLAGGNGGLVVADITNRQSPALVTSLVTPSASYGIFEASDWVYIADYASGLRIFNVLDPDEPEEAGAARTGDSALKVVVSGNYAYVADYRDGLKIIDVTDQHDPVVTGDIDTPGQAWDVALYETYVIVADYDGGIRIINAADPSNPVEIGNEILPGRAIGVAIIEYR